MDLNYANFVWSNGTRYFWEDGLPALASEDAEYAPYNDRNIYADRIDRLGWLGKERDLESGLGDHGVRKCDAGSGRFLSVDPLWEKYLGWTPYQYSANNPVNAVDVDGREVKVYSERIPASTMSKGSGSPIIGFFANMFAPRHTFMHITTDKFNAVIEMGGPSEGTTKGRLIQTDLKAGDNPTKGRIWAKEHEVKEPKEKSKYEFENKIIEIFNKMLNNKDKLPDYNGFNGPNSNGFIDFLIKSSGGELDPIPGAYRQEVKKPYEQTIINIDNTWEGE